MDELYGNAWGDTSAFAEDLQSPQPTWTSPKLTAYNDEADLAAPSWSTGNGIGWNEPSDESHGFKWSANEPDLAWAPESVYQDLPIQRSGSKEREPEDEAPLPIPNGPEVKEEVEKSEGSEPIGFRSIDDSKPVSPTLDEQHATPLSRSSSPDGFGTFETGLEEDSKPFSSALSQGIEDDAWSSPWMGSAPSEEQEVAPKVDEWEAARRQKEQLDRKIVRHIQVKSLHSV